VCVCVCVRGEKGGGNHSAAPLRWESASSRRVPLGLEPVSCPIWLSTTTCVSSCRRSFCAPPQSQNLSTQMTSARSCLVTDPSLGVTHRSQRAKDGAASVVVVVVVLIVLLQLSPMSSQRRQNDMNSRQKMHVACSMKSLHRLLSALTQPLSPFLSSHLGQ
jgi:hypothetical protein